MIKLSKLEKSISASILRRAKLIDSGFIPPKKRNLPVLSEDEKRALKASAMLDVEFKQAVYRD